MTTQQVGQEVTTAQLSLPELLKLAHRAVWDAEHEHRLQSLELAKILAGDDDAVRRIRARELLGESEIVSEWRELCHAIAERFPVPLPLLHEPDSFDTQLRDYAATVGRRDVQPNEFSAGIAQLDTQGFADEHLRAHPRLASLMGIELPCEPRSPDPAVPIPPGGRLSLGELQQLYGLDDRQTDAFRGRLARWRPKHMNGEWIELPRSYRRKSKPKYLYEPAAVWPMVKAIQQASAKHPPSVRP